jgi:aryl-alcohol dehydrogenase-like predicted oxidoreductase
MRYKKFSKSDISVSQLGYGTWGIGKTYWGGADDEESKRSLLLSVEKGVNFFDSALIYGNGHSERLLGEVEKVCGKKLFITSKIPSKKMEWPARESSSLQESFPEDQIIRMTERSLRNLNREYIDLQQFHVWNDKWADRDEWKEAVLKLKKSGKVKFFGISVNDHQAENGIEAARTGLIDSIQVIFNIFDQSPIDKLFPFCSENNISVIARVPFDEGSLAGAVKSDTVFPRGDFRNKYFAGVRKNEVWKRVQEIWNDVKEEADSIAEASLRYVISFDAVTTVIPGMRKAENLLKNIDSINKGALSSELIERLKKHRWIRNFYSF